MVTIALLLYITATVLLIIRVRSALSSHLLTFLKWGAIASALVALVIHGYQLWSGVITELGLNLSLFLVISNTWRFSLRRLILTSAGRPPARGLKS